MSKSLFLLLEQKQKQSKTKNTPISSIWLQEQGERVLEMMARDFNFSYTFELTC